MKKEQLSLSTSQMIPYLQRYEKLSMNGNIRCSSDIRNFHCVDLSEISEESENLFNKALEIYYGSDHVNAHNLLIEHLKDFKIETLLVLATGAFEEPLTEDTLEIQIRTYALIIKNTGWDGTIAMLDNMKAVCHTKEPLLAGYIWDYYSCNPCTTSQEVILTSRNFLYDNDDTIVRATLVEIYRWILDNTFENAEDFLNELKTLVQKNNDLSIKKQIDEIFYWQLSRKTH